MTMRDGFGTGRRLATIALCATALAAGTADADVLIVSSNAPGLTPGMQLDDGQKIDIPAGAKVRVMLPSGATLQINGATSRQVKEITKGEPLVEAVWAKARELLVTGGVDQSRVGAVRSFKPAPPPVAGFSWTVIAPNASGNICVERGARLAIERPAGGGAADVTIVDTAKNIRAVVGFASDATRADWPTTLQPAADTSYQITVAGAAAREVRLRPVDKAATADGAALRTLLELDCRVQAKAWAKG